MERITISMIEDRSLLAQALSFIDAVALTRERSAPPPPPQFLFGAYCNGALVGTIGLNFGTHEMPLPIESHWRFDERSTPLPYRRNEFVEIGRWMSIKPGASSLLFYAATLFSLSHRRHYCIAEMKPAITQHSTQMGFIFLPVKNAEIVLEAIPKGGRSYYLTNPPSLYMLRVEQMHQAISRLSPPPCAIDIHFMSAKGQSNEPRNH